MTIRDTVSPFVPRWLKSENGEKALYPSLLALDAWGEWVRQGIRARHPDYAPEDGLYLLQSDRMIWRGPAETETSIRARLKAWRTYHRKRGTGLGMVEALLGYMSGYSGAWVRVITDSGVWYYGDHTGARTVTTSAWNWGGATHWSQFTVILFSDGMWGSDGTYNDPVAFYGDGGVFGLSLTPQQYADIRAIIEWAKPPHATLKRIVWALDGTTWSPGHPDLPAGNYEFWTGGSPRDVIRLSSSRYTDDP